LTVLLAAHRAGARTPEGSATLPDIESVLTKATGKAHDFVEQAAAMQAKVALQQQKSRDALAAQKSAYELKLSQQAAENEAIRANNSKIDSQNHALTQANDDLTLELKSLQANNAKMRHGLQTIDEKVSAASIFVQDSLKVTDDSNAEALSVLAPTTAKPTLDHFLAVAGADRVSLLQLPRSIGQGPDDLVSVLSKSLSDIAAAEVEGAAELKAHFLANLEAGQKEQAALNATRAQLVAVQAELQAHQAKLLEAKEHLQATGKQLAQRLHGLRIFARKVDSAAAVSLDANAESGTRAPAAHSAAPPAAAPAPAKLHSSAAGDASVAVKVTSLKKVQTAKVVAPEPAVRPAPKKTEEPRKEAPPAHPKAEASATAAVAKKEVGKEKSGAVPSAPRAVKETAAPASKPPKKQVALMQSSTQQMRKVEEAPQWTKWFSALR